MLFAGIEVRTLNSEDGTSWAVLVVTPIMKRTQKLEASREIIFIDSTSSCDAAHSTVTVLLTATKAGAVPIGVLIHNQQTTDGYAAAFGLLRKSFPHCFGGLPVSSIVTEPAFFTK